ncbi:MAG TPA: STAS domain-containing protein [Thermodesulfovibrionales bacterium]|jgi:anti-sigma B factor antagonist|nr:STAS domain-containing protein [Thermodesulfovibrionales bacterium]
MEIEIVVYKGTKVMELSGEIDMYTSPELRKELMGLLQRKVSPLLVDFKEVSYIDSSGIATFVEGLKGIKTYGGRLKFFSIPDRIVEIFNFSKLDRVFEIYRNLDEAIKS